MMLATDPPNTSEGLSNSSSFPPLLVSYVANPPSGFLMLRSYKEKTVTWHVKELECWKTTVASSISQEYDFAYGLNSIRC